MASKSHKTARPLRRMLPGALLLLGGLSILLPPAGAQVRPFLQRRRPLVRPRALQRLRNDPAALRLLHLMLRPLSDYMGEQVTEVTEGGGRVSRQRIWGDTAGRVRREYISPDELNGDIMLTMPNQYRYFHKRANAIDVALWPTEWNERDKRMFALIQAGQITATRVGEEQIAGRNAAIVALSMNGGAGRQMKFWIDVMTGVQLKHEISNAAGLISRSYLTSIVIGPEAKGKIADFNPAQFSQARINTLFPPASRLGSLEEARQRLNFRPLEPANLPSGFHLTGVWVFSPNPQKKGPGAVLLRYSDGVSNFSLFQRPGGALPANPPRFNRRARRSSILHWRLPSAAGTNVDVTFIGQLAIEQIEAIYTSLR